MSFIATSIFIAILMTVPLYSMEKDDDSPKTTKVYFVDGGSFEIDCIGQFLEKIKRLPFSIELDETMIISDYDETLFKYVFKIPDRKLRSHALAQGVSIEGTSEYDKASSWFRANGYIEPYQELSPEVCKRMALRRYGARNQKETDEDPSYFYEFPHPMESRTVQKDIIRYLQEQGAFVTCVTAGSADSDCRTTPLTRLGFHHDLFVSTREWPQDRILNNKMSELLFTGEQDMKIETLCWDKLCRSIELFIRHHETRRSEKPIKNMIMIDDQKREIDAFCQHNAISVSSDIKLHGGIRLLGFRYNRSKEKLIRAEKIIGETLYMAKIKEEGDIFDFDGQRYRIGHDENDESLLKIYPVLGKRQRVRQMLQVVFPMGGLGTYIEP